MCGQATHPIGVTAKLVLAIGGDELFGGYANTFGDVPRIYQGLRSVQRIPGAARLASWGIERFYSANGWQRLADALKQPASLANAYLTRRGLFAPSEVKALINPEIWAEASKAFNPMQHIAERADDPSKIQNGMGLACRTAHLHPPPTAARQRCDEHGPFARGARAAVGHEAGGGGAALAGKHQVQRWLCTQAALAAGDG